MRGLIVDNFAGGGGASLGIEMALGRSPDIAVNHDPEAVAMHAANHPATRHLCGDVWDVKPSEVCAGRPVDLAWFSPTCSHFSRAKSGKPKDSKIRSLAWVVVRWAREVQPRVICLENVPEFLSWGPLLACGSPCQRRSGNTFRVWLGKLKAAGYDVELKELRGRDYGSPTTRNRLFLIARCDGQPIVWPEPTHGPGLIPYRSAGECIDWSMPAPSIFTRKRPLAMPTQRRIARAMHRHMLGRPDPYIVPELGALAALVQTGYGERPGQVPRALDINAPLGTVVAGGSKHAVVVACLVKHFGGNGNGGTGASLRDPMSTITCKDHHALLTAVASRSVDPVRAAGVAELLALGDGEVATNSSGVIRINGEAYQIADVGMRMLGPRELFRAQGFPDSYIIDPIVEGKRLSQTAQNRMVGNSVCPQVVAAIVSANVANRRAVAA